MSQRRAAPSVYDVRFRKPVQLGPNGRRLCTRCAVEVPKGRETFCSKECVHEWNMRTNPGYARQQVFQRDQGVCGKCGLDTLADMPIKRARGTGHRWQADHIKAVVDGGGECGLDNYRTLCTACHKAETAELAARRGEERRAAKLAAAGQLSLASTRTDG